MKKWDFIKISIDIGGSEGSSEDIVSLEQFLETGSVLLSILRRIRSARFRLA